MKLPAPNRPYNGCPVEKGKDEETQRERGLRMKDWLLSELKMSLLRRFCDRLVSAATDSRLVINWRR